MRKYKQGDQVRLIGATRNKEMVGWEGVVALMRGPHTARVWARNEADQKEFGPYGVRFDKDPNATYFCFAKDLGPVNA